MVLAGAIHVHEEPQRPLCRVTATGYHGTPSAASATPQPATTELAERIEEYIPPDLLSIIRGNGSSTSTTARSRKSRTLELVRQLNEARRAQARAFFQNYSEYAWDRHGDDEPMVLPDTGAKDGLCGEEWIHHAMQWAATHGHKHESGRFSQRRIASGVGSGCQYVEDSIKLPIGLQDVHVKHFLAHYHAAVVRKSNLPALLGIDSPSKHNAVIRCGTGEIWFMGEKDCDIKPKGDHVHLQMKRMKSGHWFLPVGRYNEVMAILGKGHLTSTSNTPVKPLPSAE